MEAEDLIRQTKAELAIPGDEPAASLRESPEWRELSRTIRQLREAANAVGEKPAGYPLAVDLMMRFLRALLPWYTRPLRQHAEQSVAAAVAVQSALEQLLARQEALEERLRRLEAAGGKGP